MLTVNTTAGYCAILATSQAYMDNKTPPRGEMMLAVDRSQPDFVPDAVAEIDVNPANSRAGARGTNLHETFLARKITRNNIIHWTGIL